MRVLVIAPEVTVGFDVNTLDNRFTISDILVKPFCKEFKDFFLTVNYFIVISLKNFTKFSKTSAICSIILRQNKKELKLIPL